MEIKVAAVRLARSGMSLSAVASGFGVHPSTVSRWWQLARQGGLNALLRKPVPGRPRKVTSTQLRSLVLRMGKTPEANGLAGRRWTARRVADLIRREYGVSYHPSHVWRLLQSLVKK